MGVASVGVVPEKPTNARQWGSYLKVTRESLPATALKKMEDTDQSRILHEVDEPGATQTDSGRRSGRF